MFDLVKSILKFDQIRIKYPVRIFVQFSSYLGQFINYICNLENHFYFQVKLTLLVRTFKEYQIQSQNEVNRLVRNGKNFHFF